MKGYSGHLRFLELKSHKNESMNEKTNNYESPGLPIRSEDPVDEENRQQQHNVDIHEDDDSKQSSENNIKEEEKEGDGANQKNKSNNESNQHVTSPTDQNDHNQNVNENSESKSQSSTSENLKFTNDHDPASPSTMIITTCPSLKTDFQNSIRCITYNTLSTHPAGSLTASLTIIFFFYCACVKIKSRRRRRRASSSRGGDKRFFYYQDYSNYNNHSFFGNYFGYGSNIDSRGEYETLNTLLDDFDEDLISYQPEDDDDSVGTIISEWSGKHGNMKELELTYIEDGELLPHEVNG